MCRPLVKNISVHRNTSSRHPLCGSQYSQCLDSWQSSGLKARPQWIIQGCDWLCWLQSPSRDQPHYRSSVLVCPSRVAVAGPSKTADLSAHVRTSHNEYGPGPSPSPVLACRVVNRCRGQRRRPTAFGSETHSVQQSRVKEAGELRANPINFIL